MPSGMDINHHLPNVPPRKDQKSSRSSEGLGARDRDLGNVARASNVQPTPHHSTSSGVLGITQTLNRQNRCYTRLRRNVTVTIWGFNS